jgi:uncharacterized protein (DUF433 family)
MNKATERDPYRRRDPRRIPAYTLVDAARYLRLPVRTIENWTYGYRYPTKIAGRRRALPLIEPDSGGARDLSFFNLVELHVLAALRRDHRLRMTNIRRAIEFVQRELGSTRPLISEEMVTDGTDIFVTTLGSLINASKSGQLAMKALLQAYLKRIDRDVQGIAIGLFPFTRPKTDATNAPVDQPRVVAIDPAIAFGRPVIAGSRVPTIEIFERFVAGESPEEIAAHFGRTVEEVLEAIRCENTATAA